MKTILEFPREAYTLPTPFILGRANQIKSLGWNLKRAEIDIGVEGARKFIDFWKPDGCLVNNDRLPAELFKGIPTVFLHRTPDKRLPDTAYFSFDESAIGELAARELLSFDLQAYAFVPYDQDTTWSNDRKDGFLAAMQVNFKGVSVFEPASRLRNTVRTRKALANWLVGLPKPVGIFAACDKTAALVIDACAYAGLHVPHDAVIIGVDNDLGICETTRPTLSSIFMNLEEDTRIVFKALQSLMSSRHAVRTRTFYGAPGGIMRRGSTMRLAREDATVIAARDMIRTRACQGLRAHDVAAIFDCSRRMAEIRFRKATGHSILEEIMDERRKQAEILVQDKRFKTVGIAARCGYASWSSVHRLLHK